jgi:hypothetical protein
MKVLLSRLRRRIVRALLTEDEMSSIDQAIQLFEWRKLTISRRSTAYTEFEIDNANYCIVILSDMIDE